MSRFYLFGLSVALVLQGCQSTRDERVMVSDRTAKFLLEGTEALRHHRFRLALALADSAEAYAANGADVHFFRGRIYSELGRFGKADTAYRTTLKLRPDYRGVWNNLGNNAFRQQRFREARRYYRNELESHPEQIPLRGMGRAYVELGKVDSARMAFRQAIRLDGEYAPAYLSLALLEEDEGDFRKALQYAEKAFHLDSTNLEYRYRYASFLLRAGEPQKAMMHLRHVVEKWPWHHGSHYNLAQALIQSGRKEEAVEYLEEAERVRATQAKIDHLDNTVRSLPDDPFSYAALAFALRRVGRYNDAMHAYKIALYLDRGDLDIRNNVANLYLILGDTTEAERQYGLILEHDSTFVDVWLNLGVVYALAGKKESARDAWQNALKFDPGNPMANAYLKKIGE